MNIYIFSDFSNYWDLLSLHSYKTLLNYFLNKILILAKNLKFLVIIDVIGLPPFVSPSFKIENIFWTDSLLQIIPLSLNIFYKAISSSSLVFEVI